ncbi:hypothetical protein AAFF_G00379930 [Aldrovandia affinis]|uniref:Mitotic interactor and substrate of PLK1 n=1 Tax=Aldrovandia affinis TaxID=143900 RepID=A0AAD7T9D9_9TELE|nr:hypothetical protein AAFF_G00379930 [Aldrovandia affinis]
MEPNEDSVTVAAEAIAGPQGPVSQGDLGSRPSMEDSDSTEDGGRDNAHTPVTELEDDWPDVPHPDWLMEEPPQSIGMETPNGSDGEVEAYHSPQPCADPAWPAEGDGERGSTRGPEGEVSDAVTGVSLAREDHAPFDGPESPPTPPLDRGSEVEKEEELSVERKEGPDAHEDTRSPKQEHKTGEEHSPDGKEEAAEKAGQSESSPVPGERMGDCEERSVDSELPDFSTAREEWAGLDSTSSPPPRPSLSRSSYRGQITDPSLTTDYQPSQEEGDSLQLGAITQDRQQGELLLHCPGSGQRGGGKERGRSGRAEKRVERLSRALLGSTRGRKGERNRGRLEQRAHAEQRPPHREEGKIDAVPRFTRATAGWRRRAARIIRVTAGCPSTSPPAAPWSFTPRNPPPPPNETPIEREIRHAVEREHSLRRSRGLARAQEFVEIPLRKPILSQTLSSKSGKGDGTDRQFAGKKMQREISLEAQREEVLVQMGKVPGFYDKGTVRQLRERKELFEAFQEKRETSGTPSKRASTSTSDLSAPGPGRTAAQHVLERGRSLDHVARSQDPGSTGSKEGGFGDGPPVPCGPTLSEGGAGQVIIFEIGPVKRPPVLEPDKPLQPVQSAGSLPEGHRVTVVDSGTVFPSSGPGGEGGGVVGETKGRAKEVDEEEEEEEEEPAMARENPFFRLRSSLSLRPEVEQDIREARQRERELRRQRTSLYGTTGAGGGRPASQETRSPTPPQNGLSSPELPSRPTSSTPPARQPLGKLDLTWPPARTSVEVAGQTEAPKSRKKIPLLHRWESAW